MPFKDALKGLTKEFDSIRQDLSRIIQPSGSHTQGQNPGQNPYGYGQQQGGYPSQQQQHQYSGYLGQPQGNYGPQQQGLNQQYPPHQQQYYQNPGQPTQPQWQSGGYNVQSQQPSQQYVSPPGQQPPYPPASAQNQQQYGHSGQQPPVSPPPQYSSPPPGVPSGPQQPYSSPPAVPYGSRPSPSQPPQEHTQPQQHHDQQYSAFQQPQQQQQHQQYGAMGQHQPQQQPYPQAQGGGIYHRFNFQPSIPISVDWDQKLGNNNGWGNAELQTYTNTPHNSFYTNDQKLVLRAISQNGQYNSARLVSRTTLGRSRGCLTAWLTSPCASGIWPAFWLLPQEPFQWPTDGEIDIAETWNGDLENHSCLHWGYYTPQDAWKHRVMGTRVPDMAQRAVKYELAWDQNEQNRQGRLVWWIDGRPIMKAPIPDRTRKMRDFQIILNIAMGGNVCQGQRPRDGQYDFVVHEITLRDEPEGGWGRFEESWRIAKDGNTM